MHILSVEHGKFLALCLAWFVSSGPKKYVCQPVQARSAYTDPTRMLQNLIGPGDQVNSFRGHFIIPYTQVENMAYL